MAPPPPRLPPAEDFVGDRVVFGPRWRTGIKALTLVACVYTGAACLTADWDGIFGPDHVFSGVRPALRSYFGSLYGTNDSGSAAPQTAEVGSSGGSSGGRSSSGGGAR
ncbi:hypothetical protein Rsub_11641 [Raphidocelis subcapitata]|uniref:Uncharacterized protein n=1 Tax=Raphidocelis subcapitata TaxID=307507 RepID=A0A2V0PMP4_9CHLO|nr:hypothetical protein Rsub_11641 [Raphidocelis subcapitata]|eukprot:GBF98647.1 hypothetical protein Rsub_11641 [Raphidocelis subcapitata]